MGRHSMIQPVKRQCARLNKNYRLGGFFWHAVSEQVMQEVHPVYERIRVDQGKRHFQLERCA